jgi:hypothetical protein
MKKTHIIWLALFAAFAFSAVAVASASAEVALWLNNGAEITTLTSVDTEGLLSLATLVIGVDVALVDCTGIFDGSVGANGEDEITALLTSGGVEVSKTALVAPALNCTGEGAECPVGDLAEVWPLHLPWTTQLELMTSSILDKLVEGPTKAGQPGYEVVCLNTNETVKSENSCSGPTSSLEENGTTDVIGKFSATESEKTSCATGESDLEGEGLTLLLTGGPLTVSDP